MASVWSHLGYGPLGTLTTDDLHHVADMETHILTVGRPIPWAGDLEPYETVIVQFLDWGAM